MGVGLFSHVARKGDQTLKQATQASSRITIPVNVQKVVGDMVLW